MTLESYWLEHCPYYDSRVVIYAHKMFIRLAAGLSQLLLWSKEIVVHSSTHYTQCSALIHFKP